ncbi:MAG: hypothetical protein KAS23_13235 [Anaerohalosphaera sp.]|nr:hypothetical protein [Anaerohalosphaera sp.]
MINVRLTKPIRCVSVVNEDGMIAANSDKDMVAAQQALDVKQQKLAELCDVLEKINNKMTHAFENFINGHNEEIAKLSVEIARKVLAAKVERNDYRIEEIIKQTLGEMHIRNDIEIHLNPSDLETLGQIIDEDQQHPLADHTLVADVNVGKAECEIIGSTGKVRSMIDQKLEHIEELLKKAQ